MEPLEFMALVEEEFDAVPDKWKARLKNVALLVEDEPDAETRKLEGLEGDDTLLGLYRGIPHTARGVDYGIGDSFLPDTITVYRLPTLEEAGSADREAVRKVVKETLWHEIAHHFGFEEDEVWKREDDRTNDYT
jgi:predicted Zn-dependent protease with MMP-like domain